MEKIKQRGIDGLKWLGGYTKTDVVYAASGSFWNTLSQVILSFSSFLLAIAFAHFVSKEAYEQHEKEVRKLVKERDGAESKSAVYRSLALCLLGFFGLVIFLLKCAAHH